MWIGSIKSLIGVTVCILLLSSATAQNAARSVNGPLTSTADSLRALGIDLSESSLIAALRNGNPEIRSLAALQLAGDHDFDAILPIEDALSIEANTRSRIGMAQALWSLHDPKGVASLQELCSTVALPIDDLVEVVQSLNNLNESSGTCAAPIFEYLDSHNDSESRLRVLPAVPDLYRWVPRDQTERIVRELRNMLVDSDGAVRMQASDGIVQIGLRSAGDALRAAIAQEQNPDIRSHLQRSMDRLEKTQ
jgi:HEAT repeat protein